MDKMRQGEIAIVLLKRVMADTLHLRDLKSSELKKRVGQSAQETGISSVELLEFMKVMGAEVLTEANKKLQETTIRSNVSVLPD